MSNEYINFHEAARFLKISRATLYRLMESGQLTPYYAPAKPRQPLFERTAVVKLANPSNRGSSMDVKLHKQARTRDQYRCVICLDDRYVMAHHVHPIESGGADTLENLITLCSYCHRSVHNKGKSLIRNAKKNGTVAIATWLLREVNK